MDIGTLSSILQVVFSVIAVWMGYIVMQKKGQTKNLIVAIIISAVIIGLGELMEVLQGSSVNAFWYEKDVVVLFLLIWGLSTLKK